MFRLVQSPTIFPACSLLRNVVGPMVDTQVVLQKGGRVYLTEVEGWEVVTKFETFEEQVAIRAAGFGWTSPADTLELEQRIARLEADLAQAREGQPRVVTIEDVRSILAAV